MLGQKIKPFNLLLINLVCVTYFLDSAPTQNYFTRNCYKIKQGQTVRAQIKTNEKLLSAKVNFLSKKYPLITSQANHYHYECYIPIECEEKTGSFPVTATVKTKEKKLLTLDSKITIEKQTFPKQKGFKVSASFLKEKVEKEGRNLKKTKKKQNVWVRGYQPSEWLNELLTKSPPQPLWKGKFIVPTKVLRYSTPFGEIRKSSSWGRYLHKGVDIVSPPRHPVKASQNGRIIVKKRCKYSGNHIVIDHGAGVFTYYLHLDSFVNIKIGSLIKKGQIIGKVGNTGYSTGYHLHWGLSVQNELVDPLEWTTTKFD